MKLRYVILLICLCLVLYLIYSRIKNPGSLNNAKQLETNIDSLKTIDEIGELPDDGSSPNAGDNISDNKIIDKRKDNTIIDYTVEETMKEKKENLIDTEKNGTIQSEPKTNKENILDGLDTTVRDRIDLIDSVDKLWKVIERKNNYNNELQSYNKDNVVITDNKIIITSYKENKGGKNYTSGMVESNYAYLYGYFEFSITLSYGKGIFPAIWLMPSDHSSYPEVDIFEMIGSEPNKFYGVIHYMNSDNNKSRSYFTKKVVLKDSYKVALNWNTDELIWYIDDNVVFRTVNGLPNQYMYIIINQAVGGDWPGEPDSQTLFPSTFTIQDIIIKPLEQQNR